MSRCRAEVGVRAEARRVAIGECTRWVIRTEQRPALSRLKKVDEEEEGETDSEVSVAEDKDLRGGPRCETVRASRRHHGEIIC